MAETLIPDGSTDFSGGMNAALSANAIGDNQYFTGINVSCQKNSLTPRWAHKQVSLDWSFAGDYTRASNYKVSFEQVFKEGKFQAFIPYSIGPDKFVIYIVSGFIFIINLATLEVQVLNKTDQLNVYADRINWSNAGEYLVIFDFPNLPFILEGIQIARADPANNEVPISVLGAYNQNRLCIANAGIDWTAGDPSGSVAAPEAPITFNEVLTPSSPYVGDVYQIPTANKNNDVITAMGFLQVLDTSTGIGPLLVATNSAIYSYRTDLPRALWQGGTSGAVFGSVLLYSAGIVGPRALANVGSDIIFVSGDGQVRALSMARNEQKLWGNSPVSREVNNFLSLIDPDLARVSVVAHHLNKIFITCNPHRVNAFSSEGVLQTDYVNSGIVVLELDNTASLNRQAPPVWAGVWTGIHYMDFTVVNNTLYCAAKHNNQNCLFIIDPASQGDFVDGKHRDVRSVLVTKEYVFTDPTTNKALHSADLGLKNVKGKIHIGVDYLPSSTETAFHWKDVYFDAPVEQCEVLPMYPNGGQAQGIRDLNIGGVSDSECIPGSRDLSYVFKGVQLRLIITGTGWEIEYVKAKALQIPQTETNPYCNKDSGEFVPAQCFDTWFIPSNDDC